MSKVFISLISCTLLSWKHLKSNYLFPENLYLLWLLKLFSSCSEKPGSNGSKHIKLLSRVGWDCKVVSTMETKKLIKAVTATFSTNPLSAFIMHLIVNNTKFLFFCDSYHATQICFNFFYSKNLQEILIPCLLFNDMHTKNFQSFLLATAFRLCYKYGWKRMLKMIACFIPMIPVMCCIHPSNSLTLCNVLNKLH